MTDTRKVKLALWRDPELEFEKFVAAVRDRWCGRALHTPGVDGLVLHVFEQAFNPSGRSSGGAPEVVASLWLRPEPLDELRGVLAGAKGALPLPDGTARSQGWVVEPHLRKEYERDWPDGEPSPGLTQHSLIAPPEGKTRAESVAHWTRHHTPLALRIHLSMCRYVQNVIVESLGPDQGEDDPFVGIAELHFYTLDDLRKRLFDSEQGKREIYDDLPRFTDLSRALSSNMRELVLRTPSP